MVDGEFFINESSSYFGVELQRSTPEVADLPPDESAAQSVAKAVRQGDSERIISIENSIRQIGSIITFEEDRDGVTMALADLFTADQLHEMNRRIIAYLGRSLDKQIKDPARPTGYSFYVKRLGFHFGSSYDDVTRSFGAFELHHENPSESATGPYESNSRNYALLAIEQMEQQFGSYYQTGMRFKLGGPTKIVKGSRVPERGIAECQFLVLDYTRDLLAQENATQAKSYNSEIMTVNDIEVNILTLLTQRSGIISEVKQVNPVIADRLDALIGDLNKLTVSVMHRGRPGVPKFRREPKLARRILANVEMLLINAEAMSETKTGEEEIPVLEI